MKRFFKTTFFVALALILITAAIVVISVVSSANDNAKSVGIIGGADGPTAILITQTLIFDNPIFVFETTLLIVSAIGCLILKDK